MYSSASIDANQFAFSVADWSDRAFLILVSSTDNLEIPNDAYTTLTQNVIGCSTQVQHSFKSTATSLMWKQLRTLTCPAYGNFGCNMNKIISGNRITGLFSWTSLMWRPIHEWYGQHIDLLLILWGSMALHHFYIQDLFRNQLRHAYQSINHYFCRKPANILSWVCDRGKIERNIHKSHRTYSHTSGRNSDLCSCMVIVPGWREQTLENFLHYNQSGISIHDGIVDQYKNHAHVASINWGGMLQYNWDNWLIC